MVADTYDTGEMRYSTGLSVLWVSPFGPLKVSAAKPLKSKPGTAPRFSSSHLAGRLVVAAQLSKKRQMVQ